MPIVKKKEKKKKERTPESLALEEQRKKEGQRFIEEREKLKQSEIKFNNAKREKARIEKIL